MSQPNDVGGKGEVSRKTGVDAAASARRRAVTRGDGRLAARAKSKLKGAIGAIPFAGTAINEVLFEARGRLKQERVNRFVQELAADVARLEEQSIDNEYLRSEEFSDLLEDVLIRVTRTRSEQKRRHLKFVLVEAIQGKTDVDFTDLFLVLLEQITDQELHVLKGFARYPLERANESKSMEMGVITYEDGLWGLPGKQAKQVVQALISKGLLADTSMSHFDSKPFERVVPTELGLRFLDWLGERSLGDDPEG